MAQDKTKNPSMVKENPGGGLRSPALSRLKSVLSLEPALILHMTGSILVFMVFQDVLLDKACRVNLGYSEEVCDALQARKTEGYEKEEKAVQALMGQAVVGRTMLENVFPIVLVFLVGAWSDKYGRKYPMLMVMGAFLLHHIFLIFANVMGNLAGVWTVTILSSLIVSITGNNACFISNAFSYTSDHTPLEERTVRTGILHSLIFFGITIGLGASGALSNAGFSFTQMYLIGLVLEVISFTYLLFSMKNHPLPGVTKGKTAYQMFMELFNFQHIKDAGYCLVKKRKGDTRLKLGLLLLSHVCVFTPMMGEMGVLYLFCRYQFKWDAATYSTYMSYKTIVGFIGNFVSMGVLAGKLKLSDTQQGTIACASTVIASLIFAFTTSSIWMYLGPIIALFSGAAMVVPRSMLSKVMPSDELGKINSCIASIESIVPLVASGVYTTVYTRFLNVLPGSFFLISGGLAIPPIIIFSLFRRSEKDASKKKD